MGSSLQKNNLNQYIKRDITSTDKKKSTIEEHDIDSNQSSSPIFTPVNLNIGVIVGLDENTQHSIAPTLPIHSPHSPLLTEESTTQHLKNTKLSARYINNASILCNIKKNNVNDYLKHDVENSSTTQTSASTTTSSSKLLCYCERKGLDSLETPNSKKTLDTGVGKRLVATRNAATSPHLDIRKLGSMNTITPSPSLTNDLCLGSADYKSNKLNIQSRSILKNENKGKQKTEKQNSAAESKSLKQLRTTRSLSPKPPTRHQYAMLVSKSSNMNIQLSHLPQSSVRTNKQQINKLCRSEQSSPNIIDGTEIHFSYNESNRSTGCLGNEFSDPWLKITGSDNISPALELPKKTEQLLSQSNTENSKDPWVKRADVDSTLKASKHELFRQSKSFSASKFDISSLITNRNLINKSSAIGVKKQLQSAPASPQFLITSDHIFTSSTCSSSCFNEKAPTRSSSFSPARIKDSQNPFTNCNLPNSPPAISVATEIINEQNKNKLKLCTNYDSLNVSNPNFLNVRHSFSSVSNQQYGEELQLNIRRLSDQIRRKESIFTKSIKTFSSDRNVRENQNNANELYQSPSDINKPSAGEKVILNRADFSEYLEQFRCSEAKKAITDKEKICLWKKDSKFHSKEQINQSKDLNKTRQSKDCLLETTC